MNLEETIKILERELPHKLPGVKAQELMAPSFRNDYKTDKNSLRESGVLLLLYKKNDTPHIVLMKRSETLRTHSGQISLPGGKKDLKDGSFYETATRETFEELGIKKEHINYLGALTPLFIPISNFMVYPFVGYSKEILTFLPNPKEVEKVIEIPLAVLLDKEIITQKIWEENGKTFRKPFFAIFEEKVWGATAMILSEFRTLLLRD